MKKYLIPILLVITILTTSVGIFALGNVTASGSIFDRDDRYPANGYRGGMMGGFYGNTTGGYRGGMMGGYYAPTISTDLSGSDYDTTSLKAALDVVLADEYKARAEYEAIVDKYGAVSPYVQLIRAETNHINALIRIYDAFDFAIPADNGVSFVTLPSSLEASYAIGIQAETANIALYQSYLDTDLPTSVRSVFLNLQNASENHLAAFTAYQNGDTTALPYGSFGGCGFRY